MSIQLYFAFLVLTAISVCESQNVITGESHTPESDMMAQAVCAGQFKDKGWVYAIRRLCVSGTPWSPSCHQVCTALVERQADSQTAGRTWGCFNGVHVYNSQLIAQRGVNKMAHKIYSYNECSGRSCGPNYCCCSAV